MHVIGRTILVVLGVFALFQVIARVTRRFLAHPAPVFIAPFLTSSWRKALQPPGKVVRYSGIEEGGQVLEIGCGNGAFTIPAARAVGGSGGICAFDIQGSMLKRLRSELMKSQNRGIQNVEAVRGNAMQLPFVDHSFDVVFLVATLPEIPDPHVALREIKRVLKPDGKLAVSEFFPDPDFPLRSTTIRWGEESGFFLEDVWGNFFHYTVRFRKNRNT